MTRGKLLSSIRIMRTLGAKKKVDKEKPVEEKTQAVVEPPKNLATDKPEPQKDTPLTKEEETKTPEQKEIPVTSEVKQPAIASEVLTPASQGISPPDNPPPPISVPIDKIGSTYSSDKPKGNKLIWIILVIIIAAIVAGGVWMYLAGSTKKEEPKTQEKTTTELEKEEITPTTAVATEEAKLDKYEIKVLNGSGVAGEASRLEESLEEGGFVVSETGNADNYDYTDTIIQAKTGIEKNFLDELKRILTKSYVLGKDAPLEATDSSDVIVIIGNKKAEEE